MAKIDLLSLEETGMVGSLEGQKVLLYGGNNLGKAIPNSVIIPTPNGMRKVGDIKVGDMLFDAQGKPTKVLEVFPQGEKEVWELTLSDGRKSKCCIEHLWGVYNSHDKYVVLSTDEIVSHFAPYRYKIPLCQPVEYQEKEFVIPPYEMGLFLGDGSFRSEVFYYSSGTTEIVEKIAKDMNWECCKYTEKNYSYIFKKDGKQVKTKEVLAQFPELIGAYSGDKFIPEDYLYSSIEQRTELLKGLLDTDGHVYPTSAISYSTVSEKLRDDVIMLCRSLGFKATWTLDRREGKNDCFAVNITVQPERKKDILSLSTHLSKIEKWEERPHKKKTNKTVSIKEINNLDYYEEMTCFKVDNEEALFLTNDYIVTHNTYQASRMPKPLLLMTEAGGNAVRCPKVNVTKWATFKDLVKQLTDEKNLDKMKEKYSTIICDTLEGLVSLCEQATCQEFNVRDLSEITGKQNGYSIYRKDFKTQINKLCSVGYLVLFIDHEEIVDKIDELTGETYSFVQPKGSGNIKSSTRFIRDMCDFCFMVKSSGIDENGDTIPSVALCKQTKHAFARSRYAIQTFIEPFTAKNMEEAIIKSIERSAENEGANLSEWKQTYDDYTKEEWIALIQPYYKAVFKKYPDVVKQIVTCELGEGNKISQATDDQLHELEVIYNKLVSFACDMGIVV